ncbi:MAG: hypothetical protein ACH255_20320 [Candidatus Thiodiazotropha sp.]
MPITDLSSTHGPPPSRHPGEGRDPGRRGSDWIPAFAGMTKIASAEPPSGWEEQPPPVFLIAYTPSRHCR